MTRNRSGLTRVACLALAVLAAAGTACAARSPADPVALADAQLAARVKTALVADEVVGPLLIEVRVSGAVVRLSGVVSSESDAARAVAVARSVAGVADVVSTIRVSPARAAAARAPAAVPQRSGSVAEPGRPNAFAVGASVGISAPRDGELGRRLSVGPSIELAPGGGLGPAVGFNWHSLEVRAGGSGAARSGTLAVRPVMAGVAYGVSGARVAASVSLVGGWAFNEFAIDEEVRATTRVVDVANSLAWRTGLSLGTRLSRRVSLTGFAGYLFTRPDLLLAEDDRIVRRKLTADTFQFEVGLVCWLF